MQTVTLYHRHTLSLKVVDTYLLQIVGAKGFGVRRGRNRPLMQQSRVILCADIILL